MKRETITQDFEYRGTQYRVTSLRNGNTVRVAMERLESNYDGTPRWQGMYGATPKFLKEYVDGERARLKAELQAEKEAAQAQKAPNAGTCAVCGGLFKVKEAVGCGGERWLVLHGYQRPGWGSIHGRCFGADSQPVELSDEGIRGWIFEIGRSQRLAEERLRRLQAREGSIGWVDQRGLYGDKGRLYTFDPDGAVRPDFTRTPKGWTTPTYERIRAERIADEESQIRWWGEARELAQAALAQWPTRKVTTLRRKD